MEEFDSISIEIDSMEKLGVMQDPRYTEYEPKQLKS